MNSATGFVIWSEGDDVENVDIQPLASWLKGERQRWWEKKAEEIGYAPAQDLNWGEQQFLAQAVIRLFDGSLEKFDAFLDEAREWGPRVLTEIDEIARERGARTSLAASDATTLLALIVAEFRLAVLPRNPYVLRYRDAIQMVADDELERQHGFRRPREYRSPLGELYRGPFADPSRWAPALAGIAAKLQRARYQVGILAIDVQAFKAQYPVRVEVEPIEEAAAIPTAFRAVAAGVMPPPSDWSVRAGEIVHDARSSLDHLMARLIDVSREAQGLPALDKRRTHFPVRAPDGYKKYKKQKPDPFEDLDGDVVREIERSLYFDPEHEYHWPDLLQTMHDLWNLDKHETLQIVWHALGDLGQIQVGWNGCDEVTQAAIWPVGAKVENGISILHLNAANPTADISISVDTHIATEVFLSGLGDAFPNARAPLVQLLSDIVEHTILTVSRFSRFFPASA